MFFVADLPSNISEYVHQAPASEWVYNIAIPEEEPSKEESNIRVILLDNQINLKERSTYIHEIYRVLNRSGVENQSNISIDFHPSYQKVILHNLYIHRKGNKINCLDLEKFEFIQQERRLDNYSYDGEKTLLTFLENVQVGDIIEYSYTIHDNNPIFNDRFFEYYDLQFDKSIGQIYYRFIKEKDRQIFYKFHGITDDFPETPPRTKLGSDMDELVWDFKDIPCRKEEVNQPSCFFYRPFLQVSEFVNWNEVAIWGAKLFAINPIENLELSKFCQEIKQSSSTQEEMVVKALDYVQKEIRYLSITEGEFSHQPHHPNVTFEKKYGDCKDKTLLLKTMLQIMGIKSSVALVNIMLKDKIDQFHPSPMAFNHAILQVVLPSGVYWLDTTRNFQEGSLENRFIWDIRKALVLDPKTIDLSVIPTNSERNCYVYKKYSLDKDTKQVRMDLERISYGILAEKYREDSQRISKQKFQKDNFYVFSGKYGKLSVISPTEIIDDKQNNTITYKESYLIENGWLETKDKRTRIFYVDSLLTNINFSSYVDVCRETPYFLKYPCNLKEIVDVYANFPVDLPIEELSFNNEVFRGKIKTIKTSYGMRIEYTMKTLQDYIPVNLFSQHRKLMNNFRSSVGNVIIYNFPCPIFTLKRVLIFIGCVISSIIILVWLRLSFIRRKSKVIFK